MERTTARCWLPQEVGDLICLFYLPVKVCPAWASCRPTQSLGPTQPVGPTQSLGPTQWKMFWKSTIIQIPTHRLLGVPLIHLSLLISILRLVQSEHHDRFQPEQEVIYDQEDFINSAPSEGFHRDKGFRNLLYDQQQQQFIDVQDDTVPALMTRDILPKKRFGVNVLPLFYHGNLHDWRHKRMKLISKRDAEKTVDLTALLNPPVIPTVINVSSINDSSHDNHTANATDMDAGKVETTTKAPEEKKPELPPPGAAEEEKHSSLTIFFILLVVAIAILLVHLLIQTKFHYMPDSIAIVLIGAFIGLFLKLFKFGNWKNEEAFPPTIFFIVLLPPIIFEGGYNLHKGNFFQNIGSILVFAVFGTVISAVVVGGGVYFLGQAEVVYKFDFVESFAFGSLVSAVDPVATLAIFQALDVDAILYMLVFGESMLNDAVSIVLTSTMLEFASPGAVVASGTTAFFQAVGRFCLMFFASSAIGVAFGLVSAMVTKFVDLHKTPSLEVGMVFCFSYLPYALAEGIHLSGIMAILFCGIVMSHYTHHNLSPISQITVQQTFRTIAFICETCVFAYLGLAIFSFKVNVKPAFTIWSIVLILLGRALNIFPLSFLVNFFREHKITRKNQFIMWFSGLRGAVAFALSLHLEFAEEKHYILVTTTLIMVLFTTVFLGGATMPLLKFLQTTDKKHKKKKLDGEVSMSKTKEMGDAIDSEHLSEMTEDDETHVIKPHMTGFTKLDARYLIPFFTKRFTQQEMREGRSQVDMLATQWQKEVRAAPSESEDDNENIEIETSLITTDSTASLYQNGTPTPSDRT